MATQTVWVNGKKVSTTSKLANSLQTAKKTLASSNTPENVTVYNAALAAISSGNNVSTPKVESTDLEYNPIKSAKPLAESKLMESADYEKELFGSTSQPKTIEEAVQKVKDEQQAAREYQMKQDALAGRAEDIQINRAEEQLAGNVAGAKAKYLTGREGVQSAGAPQVVNQYTQAAKSIVDEAKLRIQSAEAQRAEAKRLLSTAQSEDRASTAQQAQAMIAAAEQEIRQAQTDLMNAQASQANTDKIRSETLQSNFEAMGEGAANLDIATLTTMAENAGLTYGQTVAMRDMAVLTARLSKAKTQGEVDQTLAQIDKLRKETEIVGKPAAVQEFQFYNQLSPSGQQQFLQLKNAGFDFMNVPDVGIVSVNPTTGEANLVFSQEDLANGQGVTIQDIGSGIVTQDYGDTSPLKQDNVLLANGKYGTPGIDISGRANSAIPSTITGTVTFAGKNGGYGNQVIVTTTTGEQHMFNHLNSINVKQTQEVQAGDVIGGLGNTGSVIDMGGGGYHLDYRVKDANGQWIDPNQFFGKGVSIPGIQDIIVNAKQLVGTVAAQKDVEKAIKDYGKTGDKQGLQDYIKNLAANDLDAEGKKTWRVRSNIVAQGDKLKNKIDEFEAAGGDLGIFTGSVNTVLNKIGKISDPKLQAIAQDMRMILEDFARAQTGAAIQDFERVEFGKILPTIFDGKELAKAKIDAFSDYWQTTVDNTIREKIGDTAYNALYGEEVAQPEEVNYDEIWQGSLPGGNYYQPSDDILIDISEVY